MEAFQAARIPRRSRVAWRVTLLLTAMYVGWMLSLPAWPSQDGPVHLYYTQVFGTLLRQASSPYARFYAVKHLLPPYALYYYALLVLSKVVSLLLADRLVICAYMVLFVCGVRYLAMALGPEADMVTLLATPLLLSWPLGMGFVNYCLSVAVALWALGCWFRLRTAEGVWRRVAFVALAMVATLAHAVPLLFVLGVSAADLGARLLFAPASGHGVSRGRRLRRDALTWAAAALALGYVAAFTSKRPLDQRTPTAGSPVHRAVAHWMGFVQGKSLALLVGHSAALTVYRAGLSVLLAGALVAGAVQFGRDRRDRRWTAANTLFVLAAGMGLVLPWLPSDLSGAYFFTERLTVLLWVTALLACAGWRRPGDPDHRRPAVAGKGLLILFAVAVNACLLVSAERILRPIARRNAVLSRAVLPLGGKLALVLESATLPAFSGQGPAWNPDYWSGVHVLRASGAVLDNAPWLDSPIIPIGATNALPGAALPPTLANSPHALTVALPSSPELARVLESAQEVVFSPGSAGVGEETVLNAQTGTRWTCYVKAGAAFQLCTRVAP